MTKKSKSSHPSRSGPRQPNPDGYKIGPGFPPFHTRFEAGQPSPNRGGRPPKKKQEGLMKSFDSFQNQVLDHGKVKLPMSRNGETVEMTQLEVFLDMIFKHAVKGNPKAMGLYMMAQREAAEEAKVFREGILLAANEYIDRWLDVFILNEWNGKPMPAGIYPDPRDIIINPDGSVEIVGPINLQHQLLMEEIIAHRDLLIKYWNKVLSAPTSARNQLKERWRDGHKSVEEFNRSLPPRLQKSLPPLSKYLAE